MRVERMLNLAEYKRRQAAPGVKVTMKNFGRDRRYPITNRFRDPGTPLPAPDPSLLKSGVTARSEAFDFLMRRRVLIPDETQQAVRRIANARHRGDTICGGPTVRTVRLPSAGGASAAGGG